MALCIYLTNHSLNLSIRPNVPAITTSCHSSIRKWDLNRQLPGLWSTLILKIYPANVSREARFNGFRFCFRFRFPCVYTYYISLFCVADLIEFDFQLRLCCLPLLLMSCPHELLFVTILLCFIFYLLFVFSRHCFQCQVHVFHAACNVSSGCMPKTNGLPPTATPAMTMTMIFRATYYTLLNSETSDMWVVFSQSRNYGFVFHIFISILGFCNALLGGGEGQQFRVQTKLSLNACNGCEKYFIMVYCWLWW